MSAPSWERCRKHSVFLAVRACIDNHTKFVNMTSDRPLVDILPNLQLRSKDELIRIWCKEDQTSKPESDHIWKTFCLSGIHRCILMKRSLLLINTPIMTLITFLRLWTRGHRKHFLKMHLSGGSVSIDSLPSNIVIVSTLFDAPTRLLYYVWTVRTESRKRWHWCDVT